MDELIKPMLATLKKVEEHPGWFLEPKFDGIRILAYKNNGNVILKSRNQKDNTDRFPEIRDAVLSQQARQIILDGEIVTRTKEGVTSFQELQNRIGLMREEDIKEAIKKYPVVYYVFDILYLNNKDLKNLPLKERKEILRNTLKESSKIQYVPHQMGSAKNYFQKIIKTGEEGIIAKDPESKYLEGYRGSYWLKFKGRQEQEFVVGGYTRGTGARERYFGSLIIGYYEGNKLIYAAHTGSGFNTKILNELTPKLKSLEQDKCPFSSTPKSREKQYWIIPKLVVQVKFAEWTKDGHLRVPIYLGLRTDKDPKTIRRE
ncbi:MAG: non-homologous end-joining DNA ligase [Actinobacteria bacterium]|nr:non-homologous end-joining DNA ligase [Actinomycetota bacterium]